MNCCCFLNKETVSLHSRSNRTYCFHKCSCNLAIALPTLKRYSFTKRSTVVMLCKLYFIFLSPLGHVKSSVTGHVGKTKMDLKETSKFATG